MPFLMSSKTWDALSADERNVISEAAEEAKRFGRKLGSLCYWAPRRGNESARSAGLISASSIIAPVIGFIIFGVAANVSISRLFMAGIAPGLMLQRQGVHRCGARISSAEFDASADAP